MLRMFLGAVAIAVFTASNCLAGFTYDLRLDQASYTVAPSAVINSNIWLYETANGADTNATSLFTGSIGVQYNLTAGAGGASITTASGNPSFNLFNTATPIAGGFFFNNASVTQVAPSNVGGLERRLLVGNISINAGVGGTTQLTFTDPNPAANAQNISIYNPFPTQVVLDGTIFANSPSVSITAVPEPASGALLAVAGLGALAVRRFRRKATR